MEKITEKLLEELGFERETDSSNDYEEYYYKQYYKQDEDNLDCPLIGFGAYNRKNEDDEDETKTTDDWYVLYEIGDCAGFDDEEIVDVARLRDVLQATENFIKVIYNK